MPSGAVRRPRAPGASRGAARAREAAEHARVCAAQAAIPPLSAAALPARPNRRQRAAANAAATAAAPDAEAAGPAVARGFADLPLSTRTRDGLAAARFVDVTDVQRLAVPQALAGRDVLAAAPTGSGKTLAFVVPVLEALWRAKWSTYDGLGALVIAPTRELALQIFEVFRNVAKFHMISAGLVIGGKDFAFEKEKVGNMNVLVATPGRLLHHMDHVADFDCSTLQVLVLDEADRILDMGFSRSLDAILENLPKQGLQTLLFSATQTKSVKALARLSLSSPQYVSVASAHRKDVASEVVGDGGGTAPSGAVSDDEDAARSTGVDQTAEEANVKIVGTPQGLSQSYSVVEPHEKLSVLWSFIKTHIKSKVIVFLATGKQVRFVYDAFCKLRPGIPLLHIHGNMKQAKRTDMYDLFCRTKSAVLFATDIASRGLDFPDVEWVVQVDCPDDVSSYVHRVGRTARFRSNGRAMLFLCQGSEEMFLKRLEARKLRLNRTRINPERITSITPRIAALVAQNHELKSVAQRAFLFYLKSVYRQSDKEVFNAVDMDHAAFAACLGLSSAPKVTFRGEAKNRSTGGTVVIADDGKTVFGYRPRVEVDKERLAAEKKKKSAIMMVDEKSNESDDDDGGDILVRKRAGEEAEIANGLSSRGNAAEGGKGDAVSEPVTRKRKRIKLDILQHGPSGNRIVFSDDGTAMRASDAMRAEFGVDSADGENADENEPADIDEYASVVAKRLEATAADDKARERDRVRAKNMKRKERLRGKRPEAADMEDEGHNSELDSSSSSDEEFSAAIARIAGNSGKDRDSDAGTDEDDESHRSSDECEDENDMAAQALRILEQRRRR